MNKKIMR